MYQNPAATHNTIFLYLRSLLIMLCAIASNKAWSDYPAAPEFNLKNDTQAVELSAYRGKVIYIDFWASWCRPCKRSFPWMAEMKSKYADQSFEIIAINLDDDKTLAQAFLNTQKINFQIAYDPDQVVAKRYAVDGMPSSYLIDSNGKLRVRYTGFWNRSKDDKEKAIVKLLDEVQKQNNH